MSIKYRIIPDLTQQQIERFWSKVIIAGPDECWPWSGCTTNKGYGQLRTSRRTFYATRVAYRLRYKEDPGELSVLHTCDNPPCCNPAHLWLGTTRDNAQDMVAKGRSLTGDRNVARRYPEKLQRGDAHWSRRNPDKVAKGDRSGARLHPERIPQGDKRGIYTHPEAYPKGEARWNAKLTDTDIPIIRASFNAGATYTAIGNRYGVHWTTIRDTVARRNWKHIP